MRESFADYYQIHLYVFRQNVTRYRKIRNLTQQKLAEKLNISVGYPASIEAPNSNAVPSFDMICLPAYHLEVEVYDLLFVDKDILRDGNIAFR